MVYYLSLLVIILYFNSILCHSYRLPNNLKPIRYNLTIEPNLQEGLFNGSVVIDLNIIEDTKTITIHIRNITIDKNNIKVVNDDGSNILVLETPNEEENETFTILLEKELKKDKNYSLTIDSFTGSLLVEEKIGFYSATYDDENGRERRFALTDFEPDDARQAFPCFDEPALKASFVINIIRGQEYTSLANEKLDSTLDLGNGRYQDTFKETVKMSTYLVAFLVSDFQSTEATHRLRIFARPQVISQENFFYTKGVLDELLQALENFTGIDYAMSKLDLVAVPDQQFTTPAMENWGLIIFRESALSCSNSSSLPQECIKTVAHEFAHQWFGNLVTMAWWDNVWLSEGFAAYFQHYIPSMIRPDWGFMDQFVIDRLHIALEFDSDKDNRNRALNYHGSPYMCLHYLLYIKGSSVIRMAEHFLTHEVFKKGLQSYLEHNKFQSTQSNDLYNALQEAVDDASANHLLGNLTVAGILKTWTDYPGYPVVNVIRNYETGAITFTQKRCYEEKVSNDEDESIWHIPINYVFQSDSKEKVSKTTADFWLSEKNKTVDNFTLDGWLFVNIQETGYYRVNYDVDNWERLISFLNNDDFESIPALNRAHLINDAIYLVSVDELPLDILLRLMEYIRREKDYLPIGTVLHNVRTFIGIIKRNLQDEHHFQKVPFWRNSLESNLPLNEILQNYGNYLFGDLCDYLGFDEKPSDTHWDKLNRLFVTSYLGRKPRG